MSPAALLREANEPISYQVGHSWIEDKRFAFVAEWKAGAAPARERTAYFHQRNQRCQSAAVGKLKIERPMVISLVKHPCPGASVETTGIAMQGNKIVPTGLMDRIKNANLQPFGARFCSHKRVVARDRHYLVRV